MICLEVGTIEPNSDRAMSIAVIMSVYAGDKVSQFSSSIDSILNQSGLDEFKLRIYLGVDGPLSHELKQTVDSYADQIYRLSVFENNRGLSYVLNDLINVLEDEAFVFRMDADDICHHARFSSQLRYMENNPEIDIVGTYIMEMQPDDAQRIIRYPMRHEDAVAEIHKRSPFAHPTVCFRRNVFRVLKSGYPHTHLCEDVALWFACIAAGLRFANIPEPLLFFRVSDNFWKRRGVLRARAEFLLWTKGVWGIYGLNWRLAFPLMRFLYRLGPVSLQKWGYASSFRTNRNTHLQ